MKVPALSPFSLVGDTALALRYGHRNSLDIDLFYHHEFNQQQIIKELELTFKNKFEYKLQQSQIGIFCFIEDIKVDIIHYPHLPISNIVEVDEIRIYSDSDISAMKIQAILGRAQRKDFYDLYELLQHYNLKQLIHWHEEKYPSQMLAISIPYAMAYFIDADLSETPISLKNHSWEHIKKGISKVVGDYLR